MVYFKEFVYREILKNFMLCGKFTIQHNLSPVLMSKSINSCFITMFSIYWPSSWPNLAPKYGFFRETMDFYQEESVRFNNAGNLKVAIKAVWASLRPQQTSGTISKVEPPCTAAWKLCLTNSTHTVQYTNIHVCIENPFLHSFIFNIVIFCEIWLGFSWSKQNNPFCAEQHFFAKQNRHCQIHNKMMNKHQKYLVVLLEFQIFYISKSLKINKNATSRAFVSRCRLPPIYTVALLHVCKTITIKNKYK